jgi:solute:Na+ symporter, SSS family
MLTLATEDIIIILLYFVIILYVGFFLSRNKDKRNKSDFEEYLLAGRKLSLPLFVATLVATWYGNILGIGEFIYSYGIVGWVCFGLTYYISAIAFALFAAPRIRQQGARTIPEQISVKYGSRAAWGASFLILIITIPAAYLLMLGELIRMFTNWDLWFCIILGALVSLAYIYTGGLKADVFTNSVQFVLMYLGFGVLVFFAVTQLGTPSEMISKLPAAHLDVTGYHNWQYIFVWFIISMQTFVDPTFHQRCAASVTPQTARKGVLVSVALWALFDFLTLSAGLYAKAYIVSADPVLAFPLLAETILPVFWKGLFVVTLLATVMSTLDSYSFISAATIGYDIFVPVNRKFFPGKLVDKRLLTRIGLVISAVIAIIMALSINSIIEIIYLTASVAVPGLLIPLLTAYTKRFSLKKAGLICIMVFAPSISLAWIIFQKTGLAVSIGNNEIIYLISNFEPMVPGILTSFVLFLFFIRKIEVV